MKCNICGGELPYGENICKYCGNVMNLPKNETINKPKNVDMPPRYEGVRPKDEILRQESPEYCGKCGRVLDPVTHKCGECSSAEYKTRNYENYNKRVNDMPKKTKKKHTARNIILAIIGMIVLFVITLLIAFNKLPEWLGIGVTQNDEDVPVVTYTTSPRNTANPDWVADTGETKQTAKPVTPTKEPVRTPVPAPTGDPVELRGGSYIYPSDSKVITDKELDSMTRQEIKYIYWEIYARHGYTFDDELEELADYFESNHEWYMPLTSDEEKVKAEFNKEERSNIEIIEKYQKDKGWRQ